ncbi:hypothetical protein ScPMuIL_018902 [Solemya velum]
MNNIEQKLPAVIELNVGGVHYTTTLNTLTKYDDTMLASLFSGKFHVATDQGGRYFIDSDGEHFKYILNYLRYGEIPPTSVANEVYREASYFGLQGLMEQLEKCPAILAKIHRESFRSQFPGYDDAMETISDIICELSTQNKDITTEILVLLNPKYKKPNLSSFDIDHACFLKSTRTEKCAADIKIGPWESLIQDKQVVETIVKDLKYKGFSVTYDYLGQCDYQCVPPTGDDSIMHIIQSELCQKKFYRLTFHWWT